MSPTHGKILIDGIDAQELSLASLRMHMALVTQEVLLFNDTIAANIA
jgi:subfamily B ATP-binding cassette protein MsbA